MRLAVHKIVFSLAAVFSLAFALGACTAPEIESCETWRETRNNCEAANGMYEEVNYDLCNNVDPECKEFYDCAAALPCVALDNGRMGLGQPMLDVKIGGKACVDRTLDPSCNDTKPKTCCPVSNYRTLCPQPEDKECTDEDLRVLIQTDEE